MKGTNAGPNDHNIEIDLVCSLGVEHEAVAEYRKGERLFFINVRSKYACALPLSKFRIILHKYQVFFMLILMGLGIFCNYWGMKYLKFTLRLIGFTICFLFSFIVLLSLLADGFLIS
jgi:hypothetical protein